MHLLLIEKTESDSDVKDTNFSSHISAMIADTKVLQKTVVYNSKSYTTLPLASTHTHSLHSQTLKFKNVGKIDFSRFCKILYLE